MSSIQSFKDAGPWEVPSIREIARMAKYVKDDGAIAAYFHITRHEVQAVRDKIAKATPAPIVVTAKSEELVNASDRMSRLKAEDASMRLKDACHRMFEKFAGRNLLTPDEAKVVNLYGWPTLRRLQANALKALL